MAKDIFMSLGESMDKLVNIDISSRGSISYLHTAARALSAEPLTLAAAKLLKNTIKPKDRVLLTTGWMDQPEAAPGFGETDGPLGTAVLARALRLVMGAACVVVTDAELVDGMKKVFQAAGFHTVALSSLHESIEREKLMTVSILPYPVQPQDAEKAAPELIQQINPALCIAIERGGMNEAGRIHSMVGWDTSATQAKVDYLFREATARQIPTLAIGDGGNELGMANIKECIREHITYGQKCLCSCRQGIAPATTVSLLMTAAISNWGCYAIADMLAALAGKPEYLHNAETEERLLRAAADHGFHDAMTGGVGYSVDGCALPIHCSMVRLLEDLTRQGLKTR